MDLDVRQMGSDYITEWMPDRVATGRVCKIIGDEQTAQLWKQQARPHHGDTPSGLGPSMSTRA
jgi:hypothetical protein